jgi:hypothetical protein
MTVKGNEKSLHDRTGETPSDGCGVRVWARGRLKLFHRLVHDVGLSGPAACTLPAYARGSFSGIPNIEVFG